VLERDDIDRMMEGVPKLERRMGHGLRVVAALAQESSADEGRQAARASAPPPAMPGM